MFKKIVSAFGVCLLSFAVNAQTDEIVRVLQEIEQNNKELQAYSALMESKQLEWKVGNNLPDPQAGAYYLPFGDHSTGDYTEFQISQSFEFPTVYGTRNSLISKQNRQMELQYASRRQAVLLSAKKSILELAFLNKRMTVEQKRVVQAKKVVGQVNELFEKEQVGILEVNKAKIAWLQEQFKVEQVETDRQKILLILQNLNGGTAVSLNQFHLFNNLIISPLDSIWQRKKLRDPLIKILEQQEAVALQQIKLSKNMSLPNVTAGFNRQGVSGETFSGIYGGLSIPLWNNRNKVKAAEARYQYQQSYTNAQSAAGYVDFQNQYNDYQMLLSKYKEYQNTLNGLNSDALLLDAYELGELSFMVYYIELQFYRLAFDAMLEMEKQLNKLRAEIMSFEL